MMDLLVLIPSRDWQAMANALEELSKNPMLRQRMGKAASEFVKKTFTAEQQASEFAVLFGVTE